MNGRFRLLMDILFSGSLLAIAFYAGITRQEVTQLKECVRTRGCVPISVEAIERFEKEGSRLRCLESHFPECRGNQ